MVSKTTNLGLSLALWLSLIGLVNLSGLRSKVLFQGLSAPMG